MPRDTSTARSPCLRAEKCEVRRIVLTDAGGLSAPDARRVAEARAAVALRHRLSGRKISIDRRRYEQGLEIRKAGDLRDDFDRIDVLVHPQSIVHSLVEFGRFGERAPERPCAFRYGRPATTPIACRRISQVDVAVVGPANLRALDAARFPVRPDRDRGRTRGGTRAAG